MQKMADFFRRLSTKMFGNPNDYAGCRRRKFFWTCKSICAQMALLGSIFIEKSIHKDYAGGSRQKFLLSNSFYILQKCLFLAPLFNKIFTIFKRTVPATAGENFFCMSIWILIFDVLTNKKARSQLRFLARGGPSFLRGGGQIFF